VDRAAQPTLFRAGREPAVRALDRMDASSSVTIHFATEDDHAAARRWLERLAPRPTTYTDAVSFAVMEATACAVVLSFDEDFAAEASLWRRRMSRNRRRWHRASVRLSAAS
jgi:predicted nucleic acid-binding protein